MANLFCRIGGHKFVYLSKAGQHAHRFYCSRCMHLVLLKVQPEPKPPTVEGNLIQMPPRGEEKQDKTAPLFDRCEDNAGAPESAHV